VAHVKIGELDWSWYPQHSHQLCVACSVLMSRTAFLCMEMNFPPWR